MLVVHRRENIRVERAHDTTGDRQVGVLRPERRVAHESR
jgi:hypothetical protein